MRRVVLLVLLLSSLFVSHSAAQFIVDDVVVRGVVLDPSKAPIAGARVSAFPPGRQAAITTVTNPRG